MRLGIAGRGGSVRTQLMVWNACTVAVLLLGLGAIIVWSVQALLLVSVDRELVNRSRPFSGDRPGPPPGRGPGDPGGPHGPGEPGGQRRFGFFAGAGGPPDAGGPRGEGGLVGFAGPGVPGGHVAFGGRVGPGADGPPEGTGGALPRRPREDNYPVSAAMRGNIARRMGSNFFPRVLDLHGHDLVHPETPALDLASLHRAAAGRNDFATVTIDGEPARILSTPIREEGTIRGVAQIPYPLADTYRAIAEMRTTMMLLTPVALVLAGLGGALVTGRALRPMRRVVATAEQIGGHDLSQRLAVTGHDEFSHLAATFNNMLGRLETAFGKERSLVRQLETSLEQQKRFTADASHELKTPLTVAKVNTSLLLQSHPSEAEYRESLQDIDRAVDSMNRLVQDLLLLARHDAGAAAKTATEVLVRDVLQQARCGISKPAAPMIQVETSDPTLSVYGTEDDLVRAFSNLLDNAVRYSPPGGTVRASAEAEGGSVVIRVTDCGPGIAPEHLPHLGARFYRIDTARARPDGGTGLGLSISKSIVESCGGSIRFESVMGKGTTVIVTLPRSAAD